MKMASRSDASHALVTGVSGFTGHYVARELELAGYRVFGTSQASGNLGADTYTVDLCDPAATLRVVEEVRPSVVVHLAAISFVAHGDADAIYRVNMLGTRNLLQALASLNEPPRKVLLASSANVYGNANVEVLDEHAPASPANDYAVSKLAMEHMARLWMDRLPVIITRPFNYTGVGQSAHFLLPKIVSHFQRKAQYIELGNIDVERDFSDVRMVAKAYAALLERGCAGETYNVCSGVTYSLRDVLIIMSQIAGYEIEVRVNPAFVRENEVKRLQGSPGKLQEVMGGLTPIALPETLRWMYLQS